MRQYNILVNNIKKFAFGSMLTAFIMLCIHYFEVFYEFTQVYFGSCKYTENRRGETARL